jgi:uroporphyrin-III C-methyltransferase/precorrin-2 dehydrogenase/sirohydrochlorin ferrochelatase
VTLRKVSTGFVLATAHGAEDSELQHWAALVVAGLTLALYMGKSSPARRRQRLDCRGRSCRPFRSASSSGQGARTSRLYRGLRSALASAQDRRSNMPDGPAIIFVGEAIAHGDWSPTRSDRRGRIQGGGVSRAWKSSPATS